MPLVCSLPFLQRYKTIVPTSFHLSGALTAKNSRTHALANSLHTMQAEFTGEEVSEERLNNLYRQGRK